MRRLIMLRLCSFVFFICCSLTFFSCVDEGGRGNDDEEEPLWQTYPPGWTWEGKHILWLGTSIPAGGGDKSYPVYVADKLGAIVHNEARGSSMVRAYINDGKWSGIDGRGVMFSLSQTLAEKQHFIDYYSSGLDKNEKVVPGGTYGWKDFILAAPDELSEYRIETIYESSYERVLVHKYLDKTHPDFVVSPDLIVIDHGVNDLSMRWYDSSDNEACRVPKNKTDRNTYIGAVNFIVEVIKSYNPDQRIVFIGHFEPNTYKRLIKAQENLFNYYKNEYPCFKLWNELGWSQEIDPETGKTILELNAPDLLHPHQDERIDPETGYRLSLKQIGEACYEFLKEIYP